MRHFIHQFTKLFLTIAVLVAMTGIGFAHRIAPAADVDESLLAYVQAGGSLEDLCGDADFGAGHSETCEACRLVDGAVVPQAGTAAALQVAPSPQQKQNGAPFVAFAQAFNPSCPVRAPPLV